MIPSIFIEVFHSPRRKDCEDRAFVLSAVGIASTIGFDGEHFRLQVEADAASAALDHLERYEMESRPPPAPVPLPRCESTRTPGWAAWVTWRCCWALHS